MRARPPTNEKRFGKVNKAFGNGQKYFQETRNNTINSNKYPRFAGIDRCANNNVQYIFAPFDVIFVGTRISLVAFFIIIVGICFHVSALKI